MNDRAARPTRQQIVAAAGKRVADILVPGLRLVFCGINPSLYSAAVGHHFARPGNRFWPALHASRFTNRLLGAFEDRQLVRFGCGITNIVGRATAAAEELSSEELMVGAQGLERKLRRYRPAWLAFLGVTAYRTAFGRPQALLGVQAERIGNCRVWILPNPSGLNAHYQLDDFARLFSDMRRRLEAPQNG